MNMMIRCMVLAASLGLVTATVGAAPDGKAERNNHAIQVAKAWFISLMQGETAVTTSLSAVPFSFDGKHDIKTLAELKTFYDQVVEKKGKRDLKPGAVEVKSSSPETVVVSLAIDDEGIAITVKPGEACRVVGFRD